MPLHQGILRALGTGLIVALVMGVVLCALFRCVVCHGPGFQRTTEMVQPRWQIALIFSRGGSPEVAMQCERGPKVYFGPPIPPLLHYVVKFDRSWLTSLALTLGGKKPNARDAYGNTPLHSAVFYNSLRSAEVLLRSGADPDAPNVLDGHLTPLHLAAIYSNLGIDVVEVLLTHGANPEVRDERGGTPLHMAASSNDVAVAKALLQYGANPYALDSSDRTPLENARARGNMEVAQLLQEHVSWSYRCKHQPC